DLMTLDFYSPKSRRFVFILFILICLAFSNTVFGKRKQSSGRGARAQKGKKSSARNRSTSRRGRQVARSSRRGGGRLSARDIRRERAVAAREQAASIRALERRLRRPLTKRERVAELRRNSARNRRAILEARRRAEAARRAAIARQIALDKAMRDEVQAFIAKDDLTGEDAEVRRVAVNALGNHAGTVVVMDPLTGRVYSIVNQEWGLRRGFKPCSTIKLVTGVAGLSENAIPAIDTVGDGYRIDLTSALAHSDNPFFQQVGTKIGSDKMVTYARELGLGEKTGINVPFEFPGKLPEIKVGGIERRMFSHADGFEVTPLQLGTLVSAMANGGRLLVPQIPHSLKEQNKMSVKVRRQLPITTDVWQRMVPGMVGAVNYGSGRRAYDPTQTVAGKTGTCIGQGGWVGLFTSYAPLANPRLAVVVITQGTDARRHFPAAVAGEIYRELNHRFGTAINLQVASTLDDEEKEVADAEAAEENGEETAGSTNGETTTTQPATATATPRTTAPATTKIATPEPRNTVKRVLMPLGNKPVNAQKNVTTPGSTVLTPATPSSSDQRPRRIQP
ncbi:MAG TPA: penicillin-binding transpeptidase domain-containing protein, partial [Pyrinomonadaceae bacterium]|nr:penicillin-binding transpeptidase domain-containing protein [Pyrinomonadaceae bacterium]